MNELEYIQLRRRVLEDYISRGYPIITTRDYERFDVPEKDWWYLISRLQQERVIEYFATYCGVLLYRLRILPTSNLDNVNFKKLFAQYCYGDQNETKD